MLQRSYQQYIWIRDTAHCLSFQPITIILFNPDKFVSAGRTFFGLESCNLIGVGTSAIRCSDGLSNREEMKMRWCTIPHGKLFHMSDSVWQIYDTVFQKWAAVLTDAAQCVPHTTETDFFPKYPSFLDIILRMLIYILALFLVNNSLFITVRNYNLFYLGTANFKLY